METSQMEFTERALTLFTLYATHIASLRVRHSYC